jgi:surface protein
MKKILYTLLLVPFLGFAQNENPCYSVNDFMTQTEGENSSITKNFVGGWNMFGYPCSQSIDLVDAFSSIVDNISLVKDNNGNVYMPEFGFNGIGFLEGGEGYQIKMANTEYGFSFCEPITWPNHEGCTDCEASNFNQWSNVDDGSCNYDSDGDGIDDNDEIVGCQDESACNYYELATDAGGCTFAEQGFECFQITQGNIHQRVANWISNPDSTEDIYGHISDWDVSYVSDMSSLFRDYSTFNDDISSWDVSNVIDMSLMFWGAAHFSSDLSSWDVSNVTNMWAMFFNANNFTGDLSSWDVTNVINMGNMFGLTNNFTSDLSSWDVSNVINMSDMFSSCDNFTSDLSIWDVSNVNNMSSMFSNCDNFTSDLSSWDVSNVTNMTNMFIGCDNFTSDLSSWDVSNVISMWGMFHAAEIFSSNLSSWDVSNVNSMSSMFRYALNFSSDLSSWDISNVTNMSNMFDDANLSTENQCAIQTSFSTNPYWPYEWECPSLQVGDLAEGGIVFYVDETGQHGLVAAMEDIEGTYEWGCYQQEVNGADETSVGTGYQNTMDIVNQGCSTENGGITAAQAALDAEINGYSDWYLPSTEELVEMYNTIGNGSLEGNIGSFNSTHYWSSSEYDNVWAWDVNFGIDSPNSNKNNIQSVRPIRAFGNWHMGCMDETACNYNSEANMADGSCTYAEQGYDCEGNITAEIGDVMEGGYLFYIDETGEHGLVAALEDITEGSNMGIGPWGTPEGYEWGCTSTSVATAYGNYAIGTGLENTDAIVSQNCQTVNGGITAAQATLNYEIEGFTDWFLPSRDELMEMYNTIGNGGSEGDIGDFETSDIPNYWSSSESNGNVVMTGGFDYGTTSYVDKFYSFRVRAVRAF